MNDPPKAGKHRFDQCWMLGKNCGKDAAGKYRQIQGSQATRSNSETEKASPTQTLVGEPCTGFGPRLLLRPDYLRLCTAKEQGRVLAGPQLMHEVGYAADPGRWWKFLQSSRCCWWSYLKYWTRATLKAPWRGAWPTST